jgi:hypothetical protein
VADFSPDLARLAAPQLKLWPELGLGQVAEPDRAVDNGIRIASALDLAGTKAAVVQKRAEAKEYLDIDALLRHGIGR